MAEGLHEASGVAGKVQDFSMATVAIWICQ